MFKIHQKFKRHSWGRMAVGFLIVLISTNLILPSGIAYAQLISSPMPVLPTAGMMLKPSAGFSPLMLQGVTVNPNNPMELNFIVDVGDSKLEGDALKSESLKVIKYFFAALTVPEDDLWVNLSPYEAERIVPEHFGNTEMGRDLLAQDYLLKQLTASLMFPDEEVGKEFWNRVYAKSKEKFGRTDLPFNTFNKVWIVPDEATLFEEGQSVFLLDGTMKVMLERDYQALTENLTNTQFGMKDLSQEQINQTDEITSDMVREVLIPEITQEINVGATFANLRQIYSALILAAWYKKNLKESLLGQVYVGKNKIVGVDVEDKTDKEKIYQQYLEAFKKGVYNFIKEEEDVASHQIIPRKYYSGGVELGITKYDPDGDQIPGNTTTLTEYSQFTSGQSREFNEAGKVEVRTAVTEVGNNAASKSDIEDELARAAESAQPASSPIDSQFFSMAFDPAVVVAVPELVRSSLAYVNEIQSRTLTEPYQVVFAAALVPGLMRFVRFWNLDRKINQLVLAAQSENWAEKNSAIEALWAEFYNMSPDFHVSDYFYIPTERMVQTLGESLQDSTNPFLGEIKTTFLMFLKAQNIVKVSRRTDAFSVSIFKSRIADRIFSYLAAGVFLSEDIRTGLITNFSDFPTQDKRNALVGSVEYQKKEVKELVTAYDRVKEYQSMYIGNSERLDRSADFRVLLHRVYGFIQNETPFEIKLNDNDVTLQLPPKESVEDFIALLKKGAPLFPAMAINAYEEKITAFVGEVVSSSNQAEYVRLLQEKREGEQAIRGEVDQVLNRINSSERSNQVSSSPISNADQQFQDLLYAIRGNPNLNQEVVRNFVYGFVNGLEYQSEFRQLLDKEIDSQNDQSVRTVLKNIRTWAEDSLRLKQHLMGPLESYLRSSKGVVNLNEVFFLNVDFNVVRSMKELFEDGQRRHRVAFYNLLVDLYNIGDGIIDVSIDPVTQAGKESFVFRVEGSLSNEESEAWLIRSGDVKSNFKSSILVDGVTINALATFGKSSLDGFVFEVTMPIASVSAASPISNDSSPRGFLVNLKRSLAAFAVVIGLSLPAGVGAAPALDLQSLEPPPSVAATQIFQGTVEELRTQLPANLWARVQPTIGTGVEETSPGELYGPVKGEYPEYGPIVKEKADSVPQDWPERYLTSEPSVKEKLGILDVLSANAFTSGSALFSDQVIPVGAGFGSLTEGREIRTIFDLVDSRYLTPKTTQSGVVLRGAVSIRQTKDLGDGYFIGVGGRVGLNYVTEEPRFLGQLTEAAEKGFIGRVTPERRGPHALPSNAWFVDKDGKRFDFRDRVVFVAPVLTAEVGREFPETLLGWTVRVRGVAELSTVGSVLSTTTFGGGARVEAASGEVVVKGVSLGEFAVTAFTSATTPLASVAQQVLEPKSTLNYGGALGWMKNRWFLSLQYTSQQSAVDTGSLFGRRVDVGGVQLGWVFDEKDIFSMTFVEGLNFGKGGPAGNGVQVPDWFGRVEWTSVKKNKPRELSRPTGAASSPIENNFDENESDRIARLLVLIGRPINVDRIVNLVLFGKMFSSWAEEVYYKVGPHLLLKWWLGSKVGVALEGLEKGEPLPEGIVGDLAGFVRMLGDQPRMNDLIQLKNILDKLAAVVLSDTTYNGVQIRSLEFLTPYVSSTLDKFREWAQKEDSVVTIVESGVLNALFGLKGDQEIESFEERKERLEWEAEWEAITSGKDLQIRRISGEVSTNELGKKLRTFAFIAGLGLSAGVGSFTVVIPAQAAMMFTQTVIITYQGTPDVLRQSLSPEQWEEASQKMDLSKPGEWEVSLVGDKGEVVVQYVGLPNLVERITEALEALEDFDNPEVILWAIQSEINNVGEAARDFDDFNIKRGSVELDVKVMQRGVTREYTVDLLIGGQGFSVSASKLSEAFETAIEQFRIIQSASLESSASSAVEKEIAPQTKNPGGINFNPELLDLKIKRDGNGVPLPVQMQPIQMIETQIQGIIPVIINIVPIQSVPLLLGLATEIPSPTDSSEFGQGFQSRDPQDLMVSVN